MCASTRRYVSATRCDVAIREGELGSKRNALLPELGALPYPVKNDMITRRRLITKEKHTDVGKKQYTTDRNRSYDARSVFLSSGDLAVSISDCQHECSREQAGGEMYFPVSNAAND
jgi:hypothetical protein